MARLTVHGMQPTTAPAGTFRQVHFPTLMLLDQGTKEGMISRVFSSEGARTRNLPLTISMQYVDDVGHSRSVPVGALHEVTIDGAAGQMSGKGWLADTPDGHLAEIVILSKALHQNSADLGEVPPGEPQLIEHGDMFTDDDFKLEVRFNDFALTKTTLVAVPAFAPAHASLPEEVMAALGSDEPLVVDCPTTASAHTHMEEIMAGAESLPSWDYFHREEADIPHKIIVGAKDADGWIPVYGHLAIWDQPHRGYDGRTVYAPRPRQNYREWNQPSVLTDRGQVEAGPIVLYGGHVSLRDAANDPRNAWCDVKVYNGKKGPWVCGVVRPHIAEDDAHTYVARASRISGHWKNGDLCMIVSCNSEGFNIPGRGWEPAEEGELVAAFTAEDEDTIVAGFDTDLADKVPVILPSELLSLDSLTPEAQQRTLEWARQFASSNKLTIDPDAPGATLTITSDDDDFDAELARLARIRQIELEDADIS